MAKNHTTMIVADVNLERREKMELWESRIDFCDENTTDAILNPTSQGSAVKRGICLSKAIS